MEVDRHSPVHFAGKSPALPAGSLILVTGASGYIGSHVVNEALRAGYRVRGTARSLEKCEATRTIFKHNRNYCVAVVPDFQIDSAFDEAMLGCDAVIHVASDMTFGADPNKIVTPVVAGVRSILRSASRVSSVKRFVLTSSSCAVLLPSLDAPLSVDKGTWNHACIKAAWAPPPYTPDRVTAVYAASKAEGELALWEFMRTEKPQFVANAILPNVNMGRILSSPGVTGDAVRQVADGKIPTNIPPQYMIDVIDDARLHIIAAVLDESLQSDRVFAFNVAYNWTDIVNAVKEVHPEATTLAVSPENEPRDLSEVPNEQGARLLKQWYGQTSGYKPLLQTIAENLENYT